MAQGPGTATSTGAWDYDEAGRLKTLTHDLAGTASDETLSFAYNPASQMVSRTSANPLYKWTAPYPVERSYAVNGLNQYQSTAGTRAANYGYDPNGNLTSAAGADPADGTTTLTYDVENRLVSASGARTAQLTYDPLGRLWQVEGANGATTFLYDGDALVAEFDASGAMTDAYVHGDGEDDPLVWHHLADGPSLARHFLKANHQGSIIAIADNNGTATAIDSYDPWGVPGAGNQGRFGYTGQVWVPELGLWYYKARFYSSALGRFYQTDPVGYADQNNLYAYVGNDPLDHTDPTGKLDPSSAAARALIAAGETDAAGGGPENPAADVAAVVVGVSVFIYGVASGDGDRERAARTDAANGRDNSASPGRQPNSTRDTLPKPPRGPGTVPPSQRDPRRVATPAMKAAILARQDGKCANCGHPIDAGIGHHVTRHADGGKLKDIVVVCDPCHTRLHSKETSTSGGW
jgi:RHS repeat-associated protein